MIGPDKSCGDTSRKQNRVTLRWKSDGDCACDSHISPCTEIFNALDMAIAKGFGDQLVGLEMTHYAFVFFEASRLASILSQCRWVEHLSLPGCKLERFLFESCTTLKHLDLSRNRLGSIPPMVLRTRYAIFHTDSLDSIPPTLLRTRPVLTECCRYQTTQQLPRSRITSTTFRISRSAYLRPMPCSIRRWRMDGVSDADKAHLRHVWC